jgi:hypothetical protein
MDKKWIVVGCGVHTYVGKTELSDGDLRTAIARSEPIKLEETRTFSSGLIPPQKEGQGLSRRCMMLPIGITAEPITMFVQPGYYYWPQQTEGQKKAFDQHIEMFSMMWSDKVIEQDEISDQK